MFKQERHFISDFRLWSLYFFCLTEYHKNIDRNIRSIFDLVNNLVNLSIVRRSCAFWNLSYYFPCYTKLLILKVALQCNISLTISFQSLALLSSTRCTLYLQKGVARISSMHSSLLFLPPFRSYCNKQFFSNYKNSPRVCDVCNGFLRCIYYSNTLRFYNLIFGTCLRNSFSDLTYSIRFVISFCSGASCAHYLVACFLTDAKYSVLKDVKIERACENGLVMDLSLYFMRFLRLFDELYRRLSTTCSSISVHTRNVIMYLFTEMSDGSPGRRTFDNPTRYRWLNRKWRTRVYGATKLLGTFATEREPAGM